MKIVLTLEGQDELLQFGLDSFVRHNGWTDGHETSQPDFAKLVLMNFIRGQIQEYNLMKIGNPVDAVVGALDAITATLVSESQE